MNDITDKKDDEVTTSQSNNNQIISNQDVVKLIQETLKDISEDREKALTIFKNITDKEFEKTIEIMYKGEVAAKFLELANKSTSEKNKLLSVIQKFNSDKVKSDNVDKVLNSDYYNNVIDLLDQLNVVPNSRFSTKDPKKKIVEEEITDAKFTDEDGVENTFTDLDEEQDEE